MNGGQMWILEKVISLEEDLENWTMAQNLHSWMIGRLQEGAPGSSTQIGSGVYKAPLQGSIIEGGMSWTPQCIEKWFLWLFFRILSHKQFQLFTESIRPSKSDSKSPAFWDGQSNAWRFESSHTATDHWSKPMAKGPRVFPSEIWIGMGFLIGHFCESWHDMTQGQTWRRAGPFVISRVFNLFEEGDPPEREFLSLLSVLKTDLSLKNGKKQRFFLSRFWHSHKNFANLVDHFLKGQRSFCWFCCAYITYQIFLIHPWYQLLMSPKTDLKKSPKQTKTPKSSQVFFSFFWKKKTPSSPNFQQKNKKNRPELRPGCFFFLVRCT